jgi:uncharacterized protein YjbI with pentapeptide repeats
LIGSSFVQAIAIGSNFTNADLPNTNLAGANLSQARLDGANFNGANLYRTKMQHTVFDRTCLENVNLGGTAFVTFVLDTAKWLKTPNFACAKTHFALMLLLLPVADLGG